MKNFYHKQLLAATVDPSGILTASLHAGSDLERGFYDKLIRKYREESKYSTDKLMEDFKTNIYYFAHKHQLGTINRGRMTQVKPRKWMFERAMNLMVNSNIRYNDYIEYLFRLVIPFTYTSYELKQVFGYEEECSGGADLWCIFMDGTQTTYSIYTDPYGMVIGFYKDKQVGNENIHEVIYEA